MSDPFSSQTQYSLLAILLSATLVGKQRGEQGVNGSERKNSGLDCSLSL